MWQLTSTDALGAAPEARTGGLRARFSVYGVFWSRFLDWGIRRCPFFLEAPIICGYTVLFFLLAGNARRVVRRNLAALDPSSSRLRTFFRSFRVFWEFAWMLADAGRARTGVEVLAWELDGIENFESLMAADGGAIVLTAHMGSYDVAAPFFAARLGRRVTTVRVPERRADLQAYLETERAAQQTDHFRIRYNHPGAFLGVELARALAVGEVVALQGDRTPGDVAQIEVSAGGRKWLLPKGPFVLAQTVGAPIYPLFIIRRGWRSYRIVVLPPRRAAKPPPGEPLRQARQAALDELATWWTGVLESVLCQHWPRWLAFDDMFGRPGDPATSSHHSP